MTVIEEIAAYLGVSEERAQEVRDYIDANDMLDWSEASREETNEACSQALEEIAALEADDLPDAAGMRAQDIAATSEGE